MDSGTDSTSFKRKAMKVYLDPGTDSRGIVRVCDALIRYAPNEIQFVTDPRDSDFEIIHVYGRYDSIMRRAASLDRKKKLFAVIQYAIRSTIHPNVGDWVELWKRAKVVWSYYDLLEYMKEDRVGTYWYDFNFYYAPLGVDPEVFKEISQDKPFIIGASSKHALAEGARECAFAAKHVYRRMFFLGHELRRGPDIECHSNLSDDQVAMCWSKCRFISGLRRVEGFELPVIEGALCGARPIVFDRPHYRKWFDEFAIFIPEGPRDQVIDNLEEVFTGFYGGIVETDKMLIRERFNWETIISNFWKEII